MTNTDTADADGTALQVARLAHAGPAFRITVNTEEAAAAVPDIAGARRPRHRRADHRDFHYNGHQSSWSKYPVMAAALAKYRINPGNVGQTPRRIPDHRPVAIDQASRSDRRQLGLARPGAPYPAMDENAEAAEPRDAGDVMIEAMIESALRSAELAEATGLGTTALSVGQVSGVADRSTSTGAWPRGPTTRWISG